MALVTLTLKTDAAGGSGTWYGDAFARTHAALDWPWNQSDVLDFLGTDAKVGNPENGMFLRFDISAVPSGATILHAKIEISAKNIVSGGDAGAFRVGFLQNDNKWEINSAGFQEGVAADEYEFSYDLPFPTDPGTDAINAGVLVFGVFAGDGVTYVNGTDDNRVWSFGDPSSVPDHNLHATPVLAASLNLRIVLGHTKIGIVLDPWLVPVTAESIEIETDDAAPKAQAHGQILALSRELGLSPSQRRLKIDEADAPAAGDWLE